MEQKVEQGVDGLVEVGKAIGEELKNLVKEAETTFNNRESP